MKLEVQRRGEYRPDVDGLRAVAVLSVILFHIDRSLVPGGFVGVDIFFVISGFLISRNLLHDIEASRFSILEFYRRRVKRIAPALLAAVAVTLLAAETLLLPPDASEAAKSAFWSLLSLANVYFWAFTDTSYFAPDTAQMPLLHLWSLGVEEQFYFIWPVLLFLLYRPTHRRVFFYGAAVLALSSFIAGELLLGEHPSFVYYMLPTRAGELIGGTLVALITLHQAPALRAWPRWASVIAWLGIALVAFSLFGLADGDPFPGLRAIPPSLGAALLIVSGHGTQHGLTRLLSLRPIVWVGLVSYSAYLWHWPILAFIRYGHGDVSASAGLLAFAATFALAWLSYRYIEQPARRVRWKFGKVLTLQYLIPAATLAVLAFAAVRVEGYGPRLLDAGYKRELQMLQAQVAPPFQNDSVCQRQLITMDVLSDPRCVLGSGDTLRPRVVLWGDSNAAHYVGIVAAIATEAGFRFRNMEVGACPALDTDPKPYVAPARLSDCRASLQLMNAMVDDFPVVIVSNNWLSYGRGPDYLQASMQMIERLARKGKFVVVLGKIPIISRYDRQCREKALSFPNLECPDFVNPTPQDVLEVNTRLREFASRTPHTAYFDVTRYLCPNGTCSAVDRDGELLYYDKTHLNMAGSVRIGRKVVAEQGVPAAFEAAAKLWGDPEPPSAFGAGAAMR